MLNDTCFWYGQQPKRHYNGHVGIVLHPVTSIYSISLSPLHNYQDNKICIIPKVQPYITRIQRKRWCTGNLVTNLTDNYIPTRLPRQCIGEKITTIRPKYSQKLCLLAYFPFPLFFKKNTSRLCKIFRYFSFKIWSYF